MLSLFAEFGRYLKARRAWWLVPIVLGLLLVFVFALLSSASPLAPFIYPLF